MLFNDATVQFAYEYGATLPQLIWFRFFTFDSHNRYFIKTDENFIEKNSNVWSFRLLLFWVLNETKWNEMKEMIRKSLCDGIEW